MIIKSEWHQVEKRYGLDIDESILSEIYPDLEDEDIEIMLKGIEKGEVDIEQIMEDSWENNVDIDWDWLDEDDWWTDRKGGYEVTYSVDADRISVPKAAWPFPHTSVLDEVDDEISNEDLEKALTELKSEFEQLMADEDEDIEKKSINPTQDKKLNIKLYGRGTDRGIGKITKAQYEYWEENSLWLGQAVNGDYDYEENEVPKEARLPYEYYNEYEDTAFYSGCDEENCNILITDSQDNEIFDGELTEFLSAAHGEEESYYDATEEVAEMYLMNTCMEPGYYLYWQQGGKGEYFEGTIDIEDTFDPKLLKFNTVDFDGNSMITEVLYDGEVIDNWGGSWSGKWDDYQVCEVK